MNQESWGIIDFVCPFNEYRDRLDADYIIWMDTIDEGRFADTNKVFEVPLKYDIRVKEWIDLNQLRNSLAGFNPGIKGIANFLNEQISKTGQVVILLRKWNRMKKILIPLMREKRR